jgi:hypothetical protein
LTIIDRPQFANRADPQPAVACRIPQETGQWPGLDRAPAAVGLLYLQPGAVGVGGVQVSGDALLAVQLGGESNMVGVAVCEDQRPHVIEGHAEPREFAVQ